MKTIRNKLHILVITTTIAQFGIIHTMNDITHALMDTQFLYTENMLDKLNKITQKASDTQLKFSQETRLSNLGRFVNVLGPYTLTAFSGGYCAKKMLWDRKMSFPDIFVTGAGTIGSILWWRFQSKVQHQLAKRKRDTQDQYDKTFKTLAESLGKIIGTEDQQKRTRTNKKNILETSTLCDLPTKVSLEEFLAIPIGKRLENLKEVHNKLTCFERFKPQATSLKHFIARNAPGNRTSTIMSDGADNTADEEQGEQEGEGEEGEGEKEVGGEQ